MLLIIPITCQKQKKVVNPFGSISEYQHVQFPTLYMFVKWTIKECKFQQYRENANTSQSIRISRMFENSLYQTQFKKLKKKEKKKSIVIRKQINNWKKKGIKLSDMLSQDSTPDNGERGRFPVKK